MAFVIQQKGNNAVIASGQEEDGSVFLLEGNWYFTPEAIDMTHLKVTERTYTCPYKGVCYWVDLDAPDIQARNIGWVYRQPMSGYEMIQDRIGFYARDTAGTVAKVAATEAN
jgi:uncharacterized protein (DUF427 family)